MKVLSYALFMRAVLVDWGFEHYGIELLTDSSSAKRFMERRGLGKIRHIQTKFLWIQERPAAKDFELKKVNTHLNVADLMTKSLPGTTMREHLKRMEVHVCMIRSGKQRDVVT